MRRENNRQTARDFLQRLDDPTERGHVIYIRGAMQRQHRIFFVSKTEVRARGGLFGPIKLAEQRIDHDIADHRNPLFRNSLDDQVRIRVT